MSLPSPQRLRNSSGCKWRRATDNAQLLALLSSDVSNVEADRFKLTDDIFCALENNQSCTALSFNRVSATKRAGDLLSKALSFNSALTVLFFKRCALGDVGVKLLCKGLKKNATLLELQLWENNIGEAGAKDLAKTLKKNQTLTRLNLNYNAIGDKGAKSIADALRTNYGLLSLELFENDVGNLGALAFVNLINVRNTLVELDLGGNRIMQSGVTHLLGAFKNNGNLLYLNLDKNRIGNVKRQHTLENEVKRVCDVKEESFTRAVLHAVDSDKMGSWLRCKVMVVGEGKVGKTATIRSLMKLPFNSRWDSTIAVSMSNVMATANRNWVKDSEDAYVFDLAARIIADDEEAKKVKMLPKRKKRRSTFKFRLSLKAQAPPVEESTIVETVTEYELNNSSHRSLSMNLRSSGSYVAKSVAKLQNPSNGISLSIWDFGGQKVFYPLHHLFLSTHGIYLLVFDMNVSKDELLESETYIKFWLNSIHSHAPAAPLMIIGTFSDEVESLAEISVLNTSIKNLVKDTFDQVVFNESKNMWFYPIDNKSGLGIDVLRGQIEATIRGQSFVNTKVAMRWMRCLDLLTETKLRWVTLTQLKEIGKDSGLRSAQDVNDMLSLFHELGVVLYYTSTQALKEVVTLDPTWLVDCIGLVIRDSTVHQYDSAEIAPTGLESDFKELFSRGIASKDLLTYLWKEQEADFLIDLMRSLLLLSDWQFGSQEAKYLVPSMINQTGKLQPQSFTHKIIFDFSKTFLPIGFFERLVCLCVQHSWGEFDANEPVLSTNQARIFFSSKKALVLEKRESEIVINIEQDQHCREFLNIVQSFIRKIKQDGLGRNFKWALELIAGDSSVEFKEAKRRRMSPWFSRESNIADERLSRSFMSM